MNVTIDIIYDWLLAASVSAAIVLTISRARIFRALRLYLKERWPILSELVSCPYCLSHWVCLFVATLYSEHLRLHVHLGFLNIFFGALALIFPTSVIMAIIYKSIETLGPDKDNE